MLLYMEIEKMQDIVIKRLKNKLMLIINKYGENLLY